jgi:hypothetical protein
MPENTHRSQIIQLTKIIFTAIHCKKRFAPFPGIIKLFPPRESLVSDIPAGDGNVANLFFEVYLIKIVVQDLILHLLFYYKNSSHMPKKQFTSE